LSPRRSCSRLRSCDFEPRAGATGGRPHVTSSTAAPWSKSTKRPDESYQMIVRWIAHPGRAPWRCSRPRPRPS
jgi:hypothetical protein